MTHIDDPDHSWSERPMAPNVQRELYSSIHAALAVADDLATAVAGADRNDRLSALATLVAALGAYTIDYMAEVPNYARVPRPALMAALLRDVAARIERIGPGMGDGQPA
jgi:hypothetical protein